MPLNSLIKKCYLPGKTSANEQGIEVSIDRRVDELILLFDTDNDHFAKAFGNQKRSDVLFVYRKLGTNDPCKLFFVEMEGSDINDGIEQLIQTIVAFRKCVLKDLPYPPTQLKAIVAYKGCSPKDTQRKQKDFYNSCRDVDLEVKSGTRLNLRDYL